MTSAGAHDRLLDIWSAFTVLVVYEVSVTGFDRHIWDQNVQVTAVGGLVRAIIQCLKCWY
jgi:hypothetical protein